MLVSIRLYDIGNLPFSYKTFFIEVLFGLSFSCSERSWISSIVGFNAYMLVVLSVRLSTETVSAAILGFGTSLIISRDWHFILFCFLVNNNDNLKWYEGSSYLCLIVHYLIFTTSTITTNTITTPSSTMIIVTTVVIKPRLSVLAGCKVTGPLFLSL